MINEKYVNSKVGMEMEFPEEIKSMAEIYSGMTAVTMLPSELDPTSNIETMTLTIMETSLIDTYSDFISQIVEGTKTPTDGIENFSTESEPECDISNQTVLAVNKMKAIQINSECKDLTQNMRITMSIYMFMTPDYIVSPIYMTTNEIGEENDLSFFENSLNTLSIENTIDISDPYSYAELFGFKVTKEKL